MPANGAVVTLPTEIESAPAFTAATAPSPGAAPAQAGIETTIGEATASAATALAQALAEFQNGGLTSATRAAGGERIARMYELQQGALAVDFATVARREGKRVLRSYLPPEFHQQHGPDAGDAALDLYIDEVLAILGRVAAHELAFAH